MDICQERGESHLGFSLNLGCITFTAKSVELRHGFLNQISVSHQTTFMSKLVVYFPRSMFSRSPDSWIPREIRQKIRLVVNRMPVLEPKLVAGNSFRVLCRRLLRSPLFRDDLRGYDRTCMYSKMRALCRDLERQNCQSFTDFINTLRGLEMK
jgi:hypothetical protein